MCKYLPANCDSGMICTTSVLPPLCTPVTMYTALILPGSQFDKNAFNCLFVVVLLLLIQYFTKTKVLTA